MHSSQTAQGLIAVFFSVASLSINLQVPPRHWRPYAAPSCHPSPRRASLLPRFSLSAGSLCIRPLILLAMWLVYFTLPTVTLPLLHPVLRSVMKADAGGATGVLHAFSQVLVTDCSPRGKEGAFSAWHAWLRTAGACIGFAVAVVLPSSVRTSFGLSFLSVILGALVLIFGKTSHWRGTVAAGHVKEIQQVTRQESASPLNGLNTTP
ncbi:hypothetical protein J5N97_024964 [Dioscorea zingiberensis]|uniref:Uncharacterized protein n=1 Tax=Dioscorea zingiberensis TaxID=325984 RepID=A0A9D5C7F1_9LILI|nr:hypothetical protein J5N97_024964 [Dioscorea zingiberensis]